MHFHKRFAVVGILMDGNVQPVCVCVCVSELWWCDSRQLCNTRQMCRYRDFILVLLCTPDFCQIIHDFHCHRRRYRRPCHNWKWNLYYRVICPNRNQSDDANPLSKEIAGSWVWSRDASIFKGKQITCSAACSYFKCARNAREKYGSMTEPTTIFARDNNKWETHLIESRLTSSPAIISVEASGWGFGKMPWLKCAECTETTY